MKLTLNNAKGKLAQGEIIFAVTSRISNPVKSVNELEKLIRLQKMGVQDFELYTNKNEGVF